jgi:5'-methylthioadenosine phosphorylase
MAEKRIGIIGGTGLYDIEDIKQVDRIKLKTPFGDPSDELDIGQLENKEIVFLPRHGHGHRLLPSEINYRANIWAMKKLGVEWIISVSAVGSFKKEIKPLDVVLVDQFVDRTNHARQDSFFGNGIVAHIMFANPICSDLSRVIYEAGQEVGEGARIHWGGTYLNMEGPAFSTKAESKIYKSWDLDVIGMTNMTEAKLAREAEICYATLAMVTDWDCWIDNDPDAIVNVEMIMDNLEKNTQIAKRIIKSSILRIPESHNCECTSVLKYAIVTHKGIIPRKTYEKLELIIGKYIK